MEKRILGILLMGAISVWLSCATTPISIKGDAQYGNATVAYDNGDQYTGSFEKGLFEGIGRMNFHGGSSYEGEWFEGQPSGYGVLFYEDGRKYTGHFKNGRFNGTGILYNSDGTIKKRGIWENGSLEIKSTSADNCINGYGKIAYENGDNYEGYFKDGEYSGIGVLKMGDGSNPIKGVWEEGIQIGFFEGDCLEGEGIIDCSMRKTKCLRDSDRMTPFKKIPDDSIVRYKGSFKNSVFDGQGMLEIYDGSIYVGQFKAGQYGGKGVLTLKKGDRYEGVFESGRPNGRGKFTNIAGDSYIGEFKNGLYQGKGVLSLNNGNKYEGVFHANNLDDGQGVEISADGSKYVGHFKNNLYEGQGVLTCSNGDKYKGEFKNGRYSGQGSLICSNGDYFKGIFESGAYQDGQGRITNSDGSKYTGQLKNGVYSGRGVLILSDGTRMEGSFVNGNYLEPKKAEELCNKYDASDIVFALNRDVFSFFKNELKEYDTPLKKEVFRKRPEYKEYLSKLKAIEEDVKTNRVAFTLPANELCDYDLSKKGFYYNIGADYTDFGYGDYPLSIKNFCFDNIPSSTTRGVGGTIWRIFLPCDQERAIQIEDNKNDVELVFVFSVTGIVEKHYTNYVMNTGYSLKMNGKYVNVKNIEIRVVNKNTGHVIKSYYY